MAYVAWNQDRVIEAASDRPFKHNDVDAWKTVESFSPEKLVGRLAVTKERAKLKIAVICNWNDQCGISTYTQYLIDALRPKVQEIKIFSEKRGNFDNDLHDNVVRCWERGKDMRPTIRLIKEWKPDFLIIQHEFGIFPVATHFLKMIEEINSLPYMVVLHSTYKNHLDKTVCTSAIQNILVHSTDAKKALVELGHDPNVINIIPHGCVILGKSEPIWNCFQTPYALVQFGFGFHYKGVDRAIEAIAHLKKTDPKFKNIFYVYLCSQTINSKNAHADYYNFLIKKIEKMDVMDNVAIILKWNSDKIINNYLRTAKLALFPYLTDPANTVYGASGAIRVSMANEIPVIASESHLFDDLDGLVPRPRNAMELAKEIDKMFSDGKHRENHLKRCSNMIEANNWTITADRYLDVIDKIFDSNDYVKVL